LEHSKKEPFAYGVSKLVIGTVIEDLKVSTVNITELVKTFQEEVNWSTSRPLTNEAIFQFLVA